MSSQMREKSLLKGSQTNEIAFGIHDDIGKLYLVLKEKRDKMTKNINPCLVSDL